MSAPWRGTAQTVPSGPVFSKVLQKTQLLQSKLLCLVLWVGSYIKVWRVDEENYMHVAKEDYIHRMHVLG